MTDIQKAIGLLEGTTSPMGRVKNVTHHLDLRHHDLENIEGYIRRAIGHLRMAQAELDKAKEGRV